MRNRFLAGGLGMACLLTLAARLEAGNDYRVTCRDGAAPEPAGRIWDYRTGETIPLYKFPDVSQPLPVIPSIEAMKTCPLTGDKNPQVELLRIHD
jgi:hypothetical protein